MDAFDLYLVGDVESIYWDFHSLYLDQCLCENGIKLDSIEDMIFYEKPIDYAYIESGLYEVFIESPLTKGYELKILFACGVDYIDVITVMAYN